MSLSIYAQFIGQIAKAAPDAVAAIDVLGDHAEATGDRLRGMGDDLQNATRILTNTTSVGGGRSPLGMLSFRLVPGKKKGEEDGDEVSSDGFGGASAADPLAGLSPRLRMLLGLDDSASQMSAVFNEQGRQQRGAVSFAYARELVEVFARLLEAKPSFHAGAPFAQSEIIRSQQRLDQRFRDLFPQLGSIEALARELLAYMRGETTERRGAPRTTGTRGTTRGTTTTSLRILRYAGAVR